MTVSVFKTLIYGWIALSLLIFIILFFITAPYGRHTRKGWGLTINNTLGWLVMELTSPAAFAFFFFQNGEKSIVNWIFFSMWMAHYLNRSVIYPLRIPDKSKRMPLMICVSAIFFNMMNGFLNGYFLGVFKPDYAITWVSDWRFVSGVTLFAAGFFINNHSDNILLNLRRNSVKSEYKIPAGGLFKWISCPNYFGEIIEWFGWALATWSLPGLSFAMWTAANLLPRAVKHHHWYQETFESYPTKKAVIPGIL